MALAEGGVVFGLNEVRLLSSITGASWVDIEVPSLVRFSENSVSGTLRGADQISDVASIVVAIDWGLDLGGFDLEAYAAISGRTVQSNGLAYPDGIRWIDVDGGTNRFPFELRGKADGLGGDSAIIQLFRCVQSEGPGSSFGYGEFTTGAYSGIALASEADDFTNGLIGRLFNQQTGQTLANFVPTQ